MKVRHLLFSLVLVLAASPLLGASATFTPVGSTTVMAGTSVVFTIGLGVESLTGIDAADVVIGTDNAAGVSFQYSNAWTSAFSFVPAATYDWGSYAKDVYVGGTNSTSVGTGLALGTFTIDTTGLAPGTYQAMISNGVDGMSALWYQGADEALEGAATYQVAAVPEPGTLMAGLALLAPAGMVFRRRRR